MYAFHLKNGWLFVYIVFTLNIGNHQNIAFHLNSLDVSHPCILYINISLLFLLMLLLLMLFIRCCSQIRIEDHGLSIFTCSGHTIDVHQDKIPSAAKCENVKIN